MVRTIEEKVEDLSNKVDQNNKDLFDFKDTLKIIQKGNNNNKKLIFVSSIYFLSFLFLLKKK